MTAHGKSLSKPAKYVLKKLLINSGENSIECNDLSCWFYLLVYDD